ncbi:cytolethal distending toxin subunit B family protein [Yersinia enterocolitica]
MNGLLKIIFYSLSSLCLVAEANVIDYKLASWNMQGAQSGSGSNSKWIAGVTGMFTRNGMDIVALQETGAVPTTANSLPVIAGQHPEIERRIPHADRQVPMTSLDGGVATPINPGQQGVIKDKVREYLWNLGSSRRASDVYIYHFDFGRQNAASRINIAIASRIRADEVIIVPPMTSGNNARPTLGIRIGNDYFFSLPAEASGSHGNNEAPQIVQFINNYMTQTVQAARPDATWIVMGDYNRSPSELANSLTALNLPPQSYEIVAPNQATQQSNNILDYAVMGNVNRGRLGMGGLAVQMLASLMGQLSDHIGVMYRLR